MLAINRRQARTLLLLRTLSLQELLSERVWLFFQSLDGVNVKATFVMVDRKEKGQGEKSAMAEVTDEFGFPVYSVVDVYDIIEYLEEDEANKENVDRIKAYLAVNGAKE